ncbi:inhibitor of nuclear factor kappa-B kinase subunit alpha [Aplysia californica]|nr:inhibitor of nuclear factor kappa-B kinase subunit alpha [Aplysia californica]
MAESEQNANWVQLRVLGQGGFGVVSLWQNEETKAQITIKECRLKGDMKEKMWERWKMEVYIIGKLNHDNVIHAVELPSMLEPQPGDPPVLAMEFCEGGDLRKVLNKPENCCGLKESEIRQLVTGVGSAIEYLHSNRIIHRDLKPENIVLKHVDEHKTLYKIIDLGYAKELDVSSVCNSFVGTMQYLAPELFATRPYSKTVDYWSFGSLVFECIAGFRPFLPTANPVEWNEHVSKKSPDDISAQFDEHKKIKFSKELPLPNQLCRPLRGYFEQWLALMLRWDPKARGGGVIDIQGIERPKCFYLLERILSLKLLHILHVEANTVLSYTVDETKTIAMVQAAIEERTGVPREAQDIILANGVKLNPGDLAVQGCCESNVDDLILFLFRRQTINMDSYQKSELPPPVQAILRETKTLLPLKDHRKSWAQAVCWCAEQNRDYKRLILSHRAALLSLLRSNSQISKLKIQMVSDIGKLMACKEQFSLSLEFDMQQYRTTMEAGGRMLNGFCGNMFQQWSQMAQQINSFNTLHDRVKSIEDRVAVLTTEILELQRSPYGKPKQATELEIFEQKAKSLYDELLKGDKTEMMDHSRMVDVVGKAFVKRDEVTKVLFKHLSKVVDCQFRTESILPDLKLSCEDIEAARKQLVSMQQCRQADIWNLVRQNESSVSRPSTMMSMDVASMSSNMESLRLMDDCKVNSQR